MSNKAVSAYVALRSLYRANKNEMYVNVNMLCYELTGEMNYTRCIKEGIAQGINELIGAGLVSICTPAGKNEWVLNLSQLYIDTVATGVSEKDYFVQVENTEVHFVFAISGRCDKFALLRYFVLLLGTLDYNIETERNYTDKAGNLVTEHVKNFFGHMGTEYLAVLVGTSKDVGIEYTKLLEGAKLIYVYRHNRLIWDGGGNIRTFNNNYGRYKDADIIRKYALKYEEICGLEITGISKEDIDRKHRSLAQKYIHFSKGKIYDVETVKEIYCFVHEKNVELLKICADACENNPMTEYKNQIRDEACFKPYLDEEGNFITTNIEKENK